MTADQGEGVGLAEVNRVARLLIAAWGEAEGKPVSASYVATFADMARAVIADRAGWVRAEDVAEAQARARARARAWSEGYEAGDSDAYQLQLKSAGYVHGDTETPNPYRAAVLRPVEPRDLSDEEVALALLAAEALCRERHPNRWSTVTEQRVTCLSCKEAAIREFRALRPVDAPEVGGRGE